LSQYTRVTDGRTDGQTDRQTDRILITIPRLHYMQRGKKKFEYKYNYCLYKVIKLQLQITTQVIKLVI